MSQYKPYPAYKDSGVEWLGRVPEHWQVRPLGYEIELVTGYAFPSEKFNFEEGTPLVRGDNVTEGALRWGDKARFWPQMTPELDRFLLKERDVLIGMDGSKVGKNYAMVMVEDLPLLLVQRVARLRTLGAITPDFIYRLIGSPLFRRWVDLVRTDPAIPHISPKDISSFPIPVPPLVEQEAVLFHLDRETARIDALIEKKTRFIELLREKRQALITHAVTKGLDPNVKMKHSGVEWLGDVPKHWETMSLARVTVARCDGPFGSSIKSENYTDSGVRVIRLQNIGIGEFKGRDQAFISPEYCSEVIGNSHGVEFGDLLIAGLGDENNPLGRTCVAPDSLGEAIVKADCYRFRLDKSKALPSFLALQLSATARVECGFISTGSTRERLNLGLAASRVIALPDSIEEQSVIVEHTTMLTTRLDALLSKTEQSIALLKERRSALITAAVTGQIDLREAV